MKKSRDQALEELSLMLLYLTRFQEGKESARYRQIAWKNYDFDTMDRLGEQDLAYAPKGKVAYLTQGGIEKARALLKEYDLSDRDFDEKYELRQIKPEEADEAAIEAVCFPPSEACKPDIMRQRATVAPELFLVAIERSTGKMVGFVDALATNEEHLRDEIYTDISLHDPDGRNAMILGVDVLPDYRKQGIAREMVWEFLRRQEAAGRKRAVLTCVPSKVKMYKKFGFRDRGESESVWGGEKWHEMDQTLNY